MKKLVFFVLIISFLWISLAYTSSPASEETAIDYEVIPDEAIRLRILANSDSKADQQVKNQVRDRVNEEISSWVADMDDIDEARELIQKRLPEVDQLVAEVLQASGGTETYTVEYGDNVTFPMKLYGNYLYPPGEYEAILITIGEAEGSNWWCVLFPPLCFLDFSFGTTVEAGTAEEELEEVEVEEEEEVEVKFFLFEWLGWS